MKTTPWVLKNHLFPLAIFLKNEKHILRFIDPAKEKF